MKLNIFWFIFLLQALSVSSKANDISDINLYLDYKEANRLALIIGNSSYSELGDLSGVKDDVSVMENKLKGLGFETFVYENITTSEKLQLDVLTEFRRKVRQGDFVAIYLSGHGFSYGLYNYFGTTYLPKSMHEREILEYAWPIISFGDFFRFEQPAAVVVFVDACRDVASSITQDGGGPSLTKGVNDKYPDVSYSSPNFLAAYATGQGYSAEASENDPSIYTQYLVQHLSEPLEFFSMHREVRYAVKEVTHRQQVPNVNDQSDTNIYFSINENLKRDFKEQWISYFMTQNVNRIKSFTVVHSLNPYVNAAKQWLSDQKKDKQQLTSYTRLSPLVLNHAWDQANASSSAVSIVLLSNTIPLAFERSTDTSFSALKNSYADIASNGRLIVTDNKKMINPSGFEKILLQANMLAATGRVMAIDTFHAPTEPSSLASNSIEFYPNDQVTVTAVQANESTNQVWVGVKTEQSDVAYLELVADDRVDSFGLLGKSITKISVPPKPIGLKSLVDKNYLITEVQKILNDKYVITWISIGSDYSDTDDEQTRLDKDDRMIHARYALTQLGVDSNRITLSPNNMDSKDDKTTIKIFGYKAN